MCPVVPIYYFNEQISMVGKIGLMKAPLIQVINQERSLGQSVIHSLQCGFETLSFKVIANEKLVD